MFELMDQKARLHSYTPRRELHGETPVPAATLIFETVVDADVLALFSPTLRHFLFHKAEHSPDLADEAAEANDLRYPEITNALKWTLELVGAVLTIEHGLGAKSDLVLPGAKVDGFQITPAQGGMVNVRFSVGAHPDERQSGKLAFLIGTELTITLTPSPD